MEIILNPGNVKTNTFLCFSDYKGLYKPKRYT